MQLDERTTLASKRGYTPQELCSPKTAPAPLPPADQLNGSRFWALLPPEVAGLYAAFQGSECERQRDSQRACTCQHERGGKGVATTTELRRLQQEYDFDDANCH